MKHWHLAAALVCFGSTAVASPYLRLMSASQGIHQSASVAIDPNGVAPTVALTDICAITHSTVDGSIIPASWQAYVPPENLCALSFGGGGKASFSGGRLTGDAVINTGASVNLAPQIGALALRGIDSSSNPIAQAVKAAFLNVNGQGVRAGGGFNGNLVKDGVFQSAKEAFPGRGPFDIAKRAVRITVGFQWVW